jgi:hypothetical protein
MCHAKEVEIKVHETPKYNYIRMSEVPESLKHQLLVFVRNFSVPDVPEVPRGEAIYYWDWLQFINTISR